MSDDQPKDRKEIEEQSPRPDPVEPVKKPANDVPPELFTVPSGSDKELWRAGGGCGRLPAYGCAFGVVVLVAALIVGVTLMRRSVWMTFERARQQVVQGLPYDIQPGERLRTTRNLERFRTLLENTSDPYPLMGEFVKLVRGAFDDGQLSAEEVGEINEFVEKAIEDSGMPGMQLGMRNEELGIRKLGTGVQERDFGFRNPPTAAVVVQGSSEGGADEPPAGGGASRRPQGASNSDFGFSRARELQLKTQNSKLSTLNSQLLTLNSQLSTLNATCLLLASS